MNDKRKKAENTILKLISDLDPSGANTEVWKIRFSTMSDKDFDTWMKKMHLNPEHTHISVDLDQSSNRTDTMIDLDHIEKVAKKWNVKLREYVAIVEGKPAKDKGTVRSWLKETKTLLVYSSDRMGDGKEAITHYRKVMGNKQFTMLDILIDTGRKNQIRVHMSDLGCPIVGDKKYNSKTNPIRRMGLHANKLVVLHPVTGKEMTFECDIPNSFIKITE